MTESEIYSLIFWGIGVIAFPSLVAYILDKLMIKPSNGQLVNAIISLLLSIYLFTPSLTIIGKPTWVIFNIVALIFFILFLKRLNSFNQYKTVERKILNQQDDILSYINENSSYSTSVIAEIINVDKKLVMNGTIGTIEDYFREQGLIKF